MRSRPFSRSLVSGSLVGAVLVGSLTVVPAALNGNPRNGGRPVIAKPVAAPAQPAAGKPFTVSFKVTRSDNGRPFLRGKMTGDPSIAGRVVQHTESFRAGTARVSLAVPANGSGKTLRVTVAIKDGATKVTRVATYRIQGRPSVSVADASVTAATNGTLTFNRGETSKTISVDVVADLAIEQDEALAVTISGAVGATIAGAGATGRITNDDTQVPVTAGAYKGIVEGNALFLDVVDRYVTHFRSNYLRMDCGSTGVFVYGALDWGDSRFPIGADGTFTASSDSTGTVDSDPAKYHHELTGRFDGKNASGTALVSVEFDSDGTHYSCTSGPRPWTASLQG